jgi:N-acetyl-anhydromuramyl-L-alanine amidase AmpD
MKTPNFNNLTARYLKSNRKGLLGIVLHDTAGNGTHGDTVYLSNPTDGRIVSVDFTVERDGSIWKLNPDLQKFHTHHAGRATSWRNFKNAEVNQVTIGIEIVQKSNLSLEPTYPQAQVDAVAHLCAWLSKTFNINSSEITTHRQIITDGSRSDPRKFPFEGENGFWQRYWSHYNNADNFIASFEKIEIPNIDL